MYHGKLTCNGDIVLKIIFSRAILKTIIMMAGELEFEDIFYPSTQVNYPVTSHFVFFGFVLLITIILANLMVGLAVSDIQGLQLSAGLDRLSRQAELISRLESFLFSRLLNKVPSKLIQLCQKNALLRASRHHLQFWIKPNDPRENRVSALCTSFEIIWVNSTDFTWHHCINFQIGCGTSWS